MGNVRLTYADSDKNGSINANTEIISEKNYYPFGLLQKGYNNIMSANANSVAEKFGFGNKEFNDELGLDMYDYGARMLDPAIARWFNIDAKAELYFNSTPYNYVRNSPIMRIDPNGNWDITVHVAKNREENGYGVAVVTNRHGKEIYRFKVRVEGTGGRDRMKTNADTPLGSYDIPNKNMWIKASASGEKRKSYGPNDRLILSPLSGEIKDSGRTLIRVHGGRQEVYNKATGLWEKVKNPKLIKTHGCLRCSDNDVLTLKTLVERLMGDDPDEYGGVLKVIDDLDQFNSRENEIQEIFKGLLADQYPNGFPVFSEAMILSELRAEAENIYAKRMEILQKHLDNAIEAYEDYLNGKSQNY
ncbi:RHS repeat-associated core domain-containing protein [Winogradskyella sp.]|uniref:RHS repeat domain-containing protein n=1 Tax=Winogradskyella sp. TaxID=1883156 RepID=UPI002609A30F|nr:RHS repeat-associated core domain-containing protein [Winogradskyella sp.]